MVVVPVLTSRLTSATVNAWKLHCLVDEQLNRRPMSQVEFRIKETENLLLTTHPNTEDEDH